HFLNHALGLISLAAMEAGRHWFLALWRSVPGTVALYGALLVHGVLGLWLLYQRRSLHMPAWEATQYGLGLILPALLANHVTATPPCPPPASRGGRAAPPPATRAFCSCTGWSPPSAERGKPSRWCSRGRTPASACTTGCASGPGTRVWRPGCLPRRCSCRPPRW